MIPATIDPFKRQGSAITHFWHGDDKKPFDVDSIKFRSAKGATVGKEMCQLAMENPKHCGVLRRASSQWRKQSGCKPFGLTYRDSSPSSWATMFMATQYTTTYAKYIQRCLRKNRGRPDGALPPQSILRDPRIQHKFRRTVARRVHFTVNMTVPHLMIMTEASSA
eukprot:2281996-Ditylum_brightwellii.AAC.1